MTMSEFRVHRIRFFNYEPKAIQCLAYDEISSKIALSRSDGSIEIWSIRDNWLQERVIGPSEGQTVEALVWSKKRLFSAGLSGDLLEYDLLQLSPKTFVSSNSGAIWCLNVNQSQSLIAAGTEDGCVVLYEVTSDGIHYQRALDKQEGRILSIAWYSPDNLIITGGIDNIRIWSVSSGHAIQRLTLGRRESNKETIVWCVCVTKDFTIISGDSLGKTCFWNGHQGTLIKSFQTHKADVLSLCVNEAGDSVVCSGIDPALVQLEYTTTQPDSDWRMWVRSTVRTLHTHDVRALTYAGDYVVSGGVDCNLMFSLLEQKKGHRAFRKIPPIPQKNLVHCAPEANIIMFQHNTHLELWQLGETNKTSGSNSETLPLTANPIKLLELRSKGNEYIVCSAVSSGGKWLSYSDHTSLRLFHFHIEKIEVASPRLSLNRVRIVPAEVLPAHCLAFTPDGNTLVSATIQASIQVIKMDAQQPLVLATITSPADHPEPIHLLSVSKCGHHIATGDHSNRIHVYNLKTYDVTCSLPTYHCQPTAFGFSPSSKELAIVYSDQKIYEFDIENKEYTTWCRQHVNKIHPQWLKRHSKISRITYNHRNKDQLIMSDEQIICVLDKSQPFPSSEEKLFDKANWRKQTDDQQDTKHAFYFTNNYKYIMHCDLLNSDWLVVVENTPMSLISCLPPTLRQKKFGT